MNENISTFLNEYVVNPDPRYAVLLKGKWGCGKTYFIEKWLKDYEQPAEDAGAEDIVLKPIKVSLYGLTNIEQITKAIDRALHPVLYSKGVQTMKKLAKVAGKIAFRTSLDVDGNGKDETSFSASLDSLSLFDSQDENIKGVRFLIFDDIERCLIDMKQLLGYINYFVEHCGCHVVLIGDEMHATKKAKATLKEFKEKTVGREFEVKPDLDAAVAHFLNEDLPRVDWLTAQQETIKRIFRASGCDNLRILRQCLYDFKVQLLSVDGQLMEQNRVIMKNILGCFVAVYCEYKGANRDIIKSWSTTYSFALMGDQETPEKQTIRSLQNKYSSERTDGINVLNPQIMPYIVRHLEQGENIKPFMEGLLQQDQRPLDAVGKLEQFYKLDNDEFARVCQEVESMLLHNEIVNMYALGRTLSLMANLHEEHVWWMKQAVIARTKFYLAEKILPVTDKDSLFEIRNSFISGVQSWRPEKPLTSLRDITQFFLSAFDKKSDSLLNKMELALTNLSDDNVESLEELDEVTAPDRQRAYSLMPIFYRLSPSGLMNKIQGLNNCHKRTFALFLHRHFLLYCQMDDASRYRMDADVISALRDMVAIELQQTRFIERYSYEYLHKVLVFATRRCEGDGAMLMAG